MENEGLWVPIAMFIATAAILITYFYFKMRASHSMQDTVRAAIASGQELPVEILDRLGKRPRTRKDDLRRGVVAVALGLAIAAISVILGEEAAVRPILAGAALPFFVGVAYLGLWRFGGNGS